jgi:hypothetical protein
MEQRTGLILSFPQLIADGCNVIKMRLAKQS